MTDSQQWLIKPDNYRLVQAVRKRIRSVYGDDIRITSIDDVAKLFRYRNDKDISLNRMLAELASRMPLAEGGDTDNGNPNSTLRVYRGRVIDR